MAQVLPTQFSVRRWYAMKHMKRDDTAEWRALGYLLYALGAAAILVFWWRGTGHATLPTTYSLNLALGNVAGLLGTYAILWQVVLMGRNVSVDAARKGFHQACLVLGHGSRQALGGGPHL